jgi:chromosome segregation ATPase
MNNKIKILLVGLAVVCAASLVIAFQLNTVNKALRNEFSIKEQEFTSERQSLSNQLNNLQIAKKKLESEISELRAKFDVAIKERDDVKSKFDLVTKERASAVDRLQELIKENKSLTEEAAKLKETGGVSYTVSTTASEDDAYWAKLLKDKAALEIEVQNLKSQLSDAQLKGEKAMEEGRKLDLQFKTVNQARMDLERKLVYNEKLAESLSEDLVREKRDKKAIGEQLESIRQENFELKSRLMALGDKKTSLEGKLVDLQQEREILSKRLAELDQILQERVDQIIQVKDDLKAARTEAKEVSTKDARVVQLQPIVVKAAEPQSKTPGVKPGAGQILAINEENNFVIVDLGEQDGVKVGQTFNVYRNTEKIASLEVIQIRKEISAADIKSVSPGSKLKIGDLVS